MVENCKSDGGIAAGWCIHMLLSAVWEMLDCGPSSWWLREKRELGWLTIRTAGLMIRLTARLSMRHPHLARRRGQKPQRAKHFGIAWHQNKLASFVTINHSPLISFVRAWLALMDNISWRHLYLRWLSASIRCVPMPSDLNSSRALVLEGNSTRVCLLVACPDWKVCVQRARCVVGHKCGQQKAGQV